MSTGNPAQAGIQFGPTLSGKMYIAVYIHRGMRPERNQWSIPPDGEYKIFVAADQGNWHAPPGHYWGVQSYHAPTLGTRGERICKFPMGSNSANVPWHGFPVSPIDDGAGSAPPDSLVETWIQNRVVSKTIGRRIEKRKI